MKYIGGHQMNRPIKPKARPQKPIIPVSSKMNGMLSAVTSDGLSWIENNCSAKNTFLYVSNELKGLAKAWPVLIVLLVVFSYLVHLADSQIYSGEISAWQGRITEAEKVRDAAIVERDKYQLLSNSDENATVELRRIANEKFADSPPDKRVDLLLKKLDDIDSKIITPRHLTVQQHELLVEQLKSAGSFTVGLRYAHLNSEIQNYADELRTVFLEAGWKVLNPEPLFGETAGQGLGILVKDVTKPPPGSVVLQHILGTVIGPPPPGVSVPIPTEEFDLYIGYQ